MENTREKAQRERVYQRLFHQSFKRLKKQDVSERTAGQIARQVAEETLERATAPVFRTEEEYSRAIGTICKKLGEGMSHYALIEEMPYLATGRLDRVTAIASRVVPPIDPGVIGEAKKAARMERLSAGPAFLFFGLALGTLGLWYAIAAGVVVAVGGEIYAQRQMPASMRRSAAGLRVPLMVNVAAAAVALFVIAFVVPGLTLARLVSGRDRRRRRELEQRLLDADSGRRT